MRKSAFITGVGSGIGKETCLHFLRCGWNVIGILRNKKQQQDLELLSGSCPGQLSLINVDLQDSNVIDKVGLALGDMGVSQLDVVLHIAGVLEVKGCMDIDSNHIDRVFKVNFTVPVLLTQLLLPFLEESECANVLGITSMSGYQGSVRFGGLSIYGASKAALGSWLESVSVEYAEKNIHLNALAIGSVNTEMLQKAFPDYQATINPTEMAEYIYSFANHGYKFYNGKSLSVAITNP